MSEAQLAAAIGVVEGTIRSLESGNSAEPKMGAGLRMAEALGVTAWFLAFGEDPPVIKRMRRWLESQEPFDEESYLRDLAQQVREASEAHMRLTVLAALGDKVQQAPELAAALRDLQASLRSGSAVTVPPKKQK